MPKNTFLLLKKKALTFLELNVSNGPEKNCLQTD